MVILLYKLQNWTANNQYSKSIFRNGTCLDSLVVFESFAIGWFLYVGVLQILAILYDLFCGSPLHSALLLSHSLT